MNWFDIFVCILLLMASVKGYKSGLVIQLTSLVGLVAAAICAGQFADILSPYTSKISQLPSYISNPLTYILVFIAILVAFYMFGKIVEGILKLIQINFLNKMAGSLFSVIKWMFLLSILLNLLASIDKNNRLIKVETQKNAYTYSSIQKIAPLFIPFLEFETSLVD